jgi:hypothetical protein
MSSSLQYEEKQARKLERLARKAADGDEKHGATLTTGFFLTDKYQSIAND